MDRISSDEELVRSVLAGNVQAFDTLVERYFGMVYVLAYARLGHCETAEDLAQEVFLRAYLYLDNLKQPSRFSGWLSQITRNLAVDWQRRGQRASRLIPMVSLNEIPTEVPDRAMKDAREKMETEEMKSAVGNAILKLPTELREVVLLHYTENLSKNAIATRLGIHPSTVRRMLKKSVASMQGLLEPILRESAPATRAPQKATIRTIALIGAAATMSVKTKSALAAAAGGVTKLSSASFAKSGGVAAISAILGFLKAIPATIATGGKIMGIGKAIAIGTTSVAIIVGGTYYYYHQQGASKSEAVKEQEISSPVAPTAPEPTESYVQEARKGFLNYLQLWKAGDIEGIMNMWDLEVIAKSNELDIQTAKESLRQRLEQEVGEGDNLTILENVRIGSIKAVDKTKFDTDGPIMAVQAELGRGRVCELYFHKGDDGWKLIGQHPAGSEC